MAEAGIPRGTGMGYGDCGGGGHMGMGPLVTRTFRWVASDRNQSLLPTVIANLRALPAMPR